MDQQPRKFYGTSSATNSAASGSAWAEVDERFFRLVAEVFPHRFCAGASALLASNDPETVEAAPAVIVIPEARLSHEDKLALINEEIDRELELRRAAMRRHPSRRRF